jgi:CRP-like cAMP-binding protein
LPDCDSLNQRKELIFQSIIPDLEEKVALMVNIGSYITHNGEHSEKIYQVLEGELKASRNLPVKISIRD